MHCVGGSDLPSDKLWISIQVDPIKTISMILGSSDAIEGSRYPALEESVQGLNPQRTIETCERMEKLFVTELLRERKGFS